jgi:MFS family permease
MHQSNLFRERDFTLYFFAGAISSAGTTITLVVLPILVFQLTGSAFLTGLLGALEVLPYLVFGLVSGALADRMNRRRMMIVCDLINALLLASIPLAAWLNVLTIAHIYIVALLSATAFVWFDAGNFGALPTLVGRERIVEANSIITAIGTMALIVGPAVGGALAAWIGAGSAIAFDALSYVVSAVLLALIGRSFDAPRQASESTSEAISLVSRTLGDIREGLVYLWNQKLVRTLTLLGFGVSFTGGAITSLLVVYAVRALRIPDTDARIGLLFTAGAVGSLVASLALPRLIRYMSPARITMLSLFPNAFFGFALAFAPNWIIGMVTYAARQAFYMLIVINGISIRQQVTPDHLQSRVNSTARMIAWGGTPFGAAVGGLLAEATDIRTTFFVMSVLMTLLAVLGWYSPLRQESASPSMTQPVQAGE